MKVQAFLYILLIILVFGQSEAQESDLLSVQCESFDTTIGSKDFISFFSQLKGQDAWLGYPPQGEEARIGVENIAWGTQYGFLNDTEPWNKRTLLYREALSGRGTMGGIQVMVDPSHPEDVYVFIYGDVTPKTDANGEHMGRHPSCDGSDGSGSFLISLEDALKLLALVQEKPLDIWPNRDK